MIKDYSLHGIAADVQLGKNGGHVAFGDGAFSMLAADGSTLSRLQAAPAMVATDVVTLANLDAAIALAATQASTWQASIDAKIAALQQLVADHSASSLMAANGGYSLTVDETGAHVACSTNPPLTVLSEASGASITTPGPNLTISGADADKAGSVVIRAGASPSSSARGTVSIHDLIDPAAPQDAVNLASQQAAIAQALATLASGSVRAALGSFLEKSGTAPVAAIPASTLLRCKVLVVSPFASGATITLKTSTSTLVEDASIDGSHIGIYVVELIESTAADTLSVEITTPGGTGSAAVAVEYVAA